MLKLVKLKTFIIMAHTLFVFWVFLLSAYLVSGSEIQTGGGSGSTAGRYSIAIEVDREPLFNLYPVDLNDLPAASFVDSELHIQDGPLFEDVLGMIGIDEYETATFYGIARMQNHMGPPANLTLTRAEIESQLVLLDRTEQGKFKLAAENVLKDDWIINITKISVSTS